MSAHDDKTNRQAEEVLEDYRRLINENRDLRAQLFRSTNALDRSHRTYLSQRATIQRLREELALLQVAHAAATKAGAA